MPENSASIFALPPQEGRTPAYQALAERIQRLISAGVLKVGEALPSSRALALELGLSRKTVVTAYERLTFAGWLTVRERIGIFVADRTTSVEADRQSAPALMTIDDGKADASIAPVGEVGRALRTLFGGAGALAALAASPAAGSDTLRAAVSTMLAEERDLGATADEVMIVATRQAALTIIAHSLLRTGDAVAISTPCCPRTRAALTAAGLIVVPIAMDAEGLRTDDLEKAVVHQNVRTVFTTPRHHYPTMVPLSTGRRRELARLAERHALLVVEDDADCDIRYDSRPQRPLTVRTPRSQSVYVGSFATTLAPGLEAAFIVASADNVRRLTRCAALFGLPGGGLVHEALAALITSGDARRHARRAARLYRERQDYLVDALRTRLPDVVRFAVPTGGLALWVEITLPLTRTDLSARLERQGLHMAVFDAPQGGVGLRIGYATLTPERTDEMIERITAALRGIAR